MATNIKKADLSKASGGKGQSTAAVVKLSKDQQKQVVGTGPLPRRFTVTQGKAPAGETSVDRGQLPLGDCTGFGGKVKVLES